MQVAELIIAGEQYDFFLFHEEDAPIAIKRFQKLVEAEIYNNWIIEYKVTDRLLKVGPQYEHIPYADRPLTRVDHNAKSHRYGFLSFVGADEYHVSDRLMIVLNNEDGSNYDGICSPIGMIAIDHHVKINSLEKGLIIEKISINDYPKEEILARIPSFI